MLAAAIAAPLRAAQPVMPFNVDQLAQFLARARGQKDAKVAKELSTVEPTQRISVARLAQWEDEFRGRRTRQALTELADASSFLNLPPSDIPDQAPPDLASMRAILVRSIAYVKQTLHKLPDFYALRTTTNYKDPLALLQDQRSLCNSPGLRSICMADAGEAASAGAVNSTPHLVAGRSHAIVTYVDGEEIDNGHRGAASSTSHPLSGLVTTGEFGPILDVVLGDALNGNVFWSHWEHGPDGLLAVFRYAVPAAKSHYKVTLPTGTGLQSFEPAYHGEIAIDPASGAIYRITVIADPAPPYELIEVSMMVQYGSVIIGGKSYICPLKGVAISRLPTILRLPGWRSPEEVPLTWLNDITFTRYHLFRAQVKILR